MDRLDPDEESLRTAIAVGVSQYLGSTEYYIKNKLYPPAGVAHSPKKENFANLNTQEVAFDFIAKISGRHLLALELKHTREFAPDGEGLYRRFTPGEPQHRVLKALEMQRVPVRYCVNTANYLHETTSFSDSVEPVAVNECVVKNPVMMQRKLNVDISQNTTLREFIDYLLAEPVGMFAGLAFMFDLWRGSGSYGSPGAKFMLLAYGLTASGWEVDAFSDEELRIVFSKAIFAEIKNRINMNLDALAVIDQNEDVIARVFEKFQNDFTNAVSEAYRMRTGKNFRVVATPIETKSTRLLRQKRAIQKKLNDSRGDAIR